VRVLVWHIHGSYATALFSGPHTYLIPTIPGAPAPYDGTQPLRGWSEAVVEIAPADVATAEVDVVVLQRPEEFELARVMLGGRVPGRDVPVVYLEHNTSRAGIEQMRHPMADRDDVLLVHVTHFNAVMYDNGGTRTRVIEHGIPDPGYRFTGEVAAAVCAINEPVRRARVTGSDLLAPLSQRSGARIDLFGIAAELMGGRDLDPVTLHVEMPKRRAYVHPHRWTSLGLTLLEAMHLGLPPVMLSTTEAAEVLPADAVVMSNDLDVLARALRQLVADPDEARERGLLARKAVQDRFALRRFLDDWDAVLAEAVAA
jgi:hypothetical protein